MHTSPAAHTDSTRQIKRSDPLANELAELARAVADTPEPADGDQPPAQQPPPSARRTEEDSLQLAADLVGGLEALGSPPIAAPPPLATVLSSAGLACGCASELSSATGFGQSRRRRHGSRVQPLATADSGAASDGDGRMADYAFPSARGEARAASPPA